MLHHPSVVGLYISVKQNLAPYRTAHCAPPESQLNHQKPQIIHRLWWLLTWKRISPGSSILRIVFQVITTCTSLSLQGSQARTAPLNIKHKLMFYCLHHLLIVPWRPFLHCIYISATIQKRLKKEKKAKRKLQEALEFESKRREQVEQALKQATSGDGLRMLNGNVLVGLSQSA